MSTKQKIAELRAKMLAAANSAEAFQQTAEREKRNLTKVEVEEVDKALAEFDSIKAEVTRLERIESAQAHLGTPRPKASGANPAGATATGPEILDFQSPEATDRRAKFFRAVMNAGMGRHFDLADIQAVAGDQVQEAAGGDGGYALPVDKRELQYLLSPPETIHGRCDQLTTQTNAVTLPTDEDADWSAIMAAADVAEGAALVETKPSLKTNTLTLAKRGVLVRVTGEMLEDVSGIEQYVLQKTARKLRWYLSALAFTAFKASGAKVTVPKTVGAAVGSAPDLSNIQKIWTQMLPEHRAEGVWLANPQLETVLQGLSLAGANSGLFPAYLPAGGISQAPFATLFGRPVLFFEGANAIGTEGDLSLAAPQAFWCITKANGPRSAASIHYEFAKDIVAYRSYVRTVFGSKFSAKILRGDGVNYAGNMVTLATR